MNDDVIIQLMNRISALEERVARSESVEIASNGVGGAGVAGAANRVAYWLDRFTLTHSANFTFVSDSLNLFNGVLNVFRAAADAVQTITSGTGVNYFASAINFYHEVLAPSLRIQIGKTATAAADFVIAAFDNAGAFLSIPLTVIRLTAQIYTSTSLGIGSATFPSGGGTPVIVIAQAGSDPTGMPSNTAGVFAKDVAGTCELFGIDEAGNVQQLTGHFDPDEAVRLGIVIDANDPYPRVEHEMNIYLGKRALTYVSPLTGIRQRVVIDMPAGEVQDWDRVHNALQAQRNQQIAEWDTLPDRVKAVSIRPLPYPRKPTPGWIANRIPPRGTGTTRK